MTRSRKQFSDFNRAVAAARTAKEFRREVVGFAKTLGFDTVSATTVIDHPGDVPEFHAVDNTPPEYFDIYHDPNLGKLDPVTQHCKRSCQAIVWDQSTYVAKGMGNLWELQARHGYRHGIAMAIHSIGGRHLMIGLDRDRPIDEPPEVVAAMIESVRDFLTHAEAAAYEIFDPDSRLEVPLSSLSRVEIESLKWSMDGLLTREVAEKMNISAGELALHLSSAMRKLRCNTRYHAVIAALRLGLLRI